MPLEPGTTLGPYSVTAKLGEGEMGEVHRARDTKLDRDVALKVLPEAFTSDPDRLARFEREAKVVQRSRTSSWMSAWRRHMRERVMTDKRHKTTTPARHIVWAIGLTVTAWAALASWPAAQQAPSARLNKIIEQFEQGEAALGNEHWRTTSLEHNPFMVDDLEAFLNEIEAEGAGRPRLTPIVRIHHEADQDFHHVVKQILDAGAFGIVLPQVRSPEEVTKLVRAMRYPPQRGAQYPEPRGRRGWGPTAATRVWNLSADEYARKADVWPLNPEGELLAIIMCETRECVENIDEILQVPGLGAVMIGSADLSLALGVGTPAANPRAPEVEAAIKTVGEACMRHNVPCGIGTGSSLSTSPTRILAGLGRE